MNDRAAQQTIRELQHRIDLSSDEEEKRRLQDTLAEFKGDALAGAAFDREGADATS